MVRLKCIAQINRWFASLFIHSPGCFFLGNCNSLGTVLRSRKTKANSLRHTFSDSDASQPHGLTTPSREKFAVGATSCRTSCRKVCVAGQVGYCSGTSGIPTHTHTRIILTYIYIYMFLHVFALLHIFPLKISNINRGRRNIGPSKSASLRIALETVNVVLILSCN